MSLLKRRVVDTSIEERILIGLVTSDSFCRDMFPLIQKETIETPYIARIIHWCRDYYEQYKQAPSAHIKDIYEIEREGLDKPEQDAISALLTKLSEEYSLAAVNEDYIKDKALNYIRLRGLKYATSQTSALVEMGRVDEAEAEINKYRAVRIETSKWEDPFHPTVVQNHFADEQAQKNIIFKLPGAIGNFLGSFERNWLVGIMAPAKRGKTFWLLELALQAVFAKRRVVIISLEMNRARIRKRIYNRLTSMSGETRDYIYPVFDCFKNQDNSCNKSSRTNGIRLLDSEGQKPVYNPEDKYLSCTTCRGTQDFNPATWLTTTKVERMKNRKAMKMINAQASHFGYNSSFGSNLRILDYPAFSANLARVKYDILDLIEGQNFIPDLIVIDYADILAPEDNRIVGRERIDQTWKSLKGMTDELHCTVATASQSNRASFDKKNVVQTDAAEDIRKIANSDLFLAINQTAQEKKASVTRIAKIASRDQLFDQYSSVIVLQQLALGQVLLDSHLDTATTSMETGYEDFFI